MKVYRIQITETLQRIVEVEAESVEEALSKTEDKYVRGELTLDDTHFVDYEINDYKED